MINVAIVGYGYWGPNLTRNFASLDNCRVKTIVDHRPERLRKAKSTFNNTIKLTSNFNDIIEDKEIDAVIIATPVKTHFELGYKVLKSGRHLFLEKPLASSAKEATELLRLTEKMRKITLVDHTFVYTPATRKIKSLIDENQIGNILYLDTVRANLGLFQSDVNVVWDLGPHDISVVLYLLGKKPNALRATGSSHFAKELKMEIENIAYVTLFFDSKVIAHLSLSWLSPVKVRLMVIGGSRRMIILDDNLPAEKVRIYDKGIFIENHAKENQKYFMRVQYRVGDMYSPAIENVETLSIIAKHFIDCIVNNKKPATGAHEGLEVVQILEACEKSIKSKGELVKLK